MCAQISVVDPNTLILDPDPGFWLNLDPDPGLDPGLYHQFWKKNKIILDKTIFFKTVYFLKLLVLYNIIITKCHLKNFVPILTTKLNSELWIFCLKSHIFCFHFILYLHVWIRICIPNTVPDPESSWIRIQYGSGSTTS